MKRRAVLEAFQRSDDENEDVLENPQFITGLNTEGDIEYKSKEIQQAHIEKRTPKIIHVPTNKSWLEERKKRLEHQALQKEKENAPERLPEIGLNYGLNVKQSAVDSTKPRDADNSASLELETNRIEGSEPNATVLSQQNASADREDSSELPLEVKMILENQNSENVLSGTSQAKIISNQAVNEREMYNRDVELLPNSSDLKDYTDIPVEDFGAAMLRGMGWNGKLSSKDAFEVNRRPTFLGMGAKPMDLGVPEVGSWGKQDPKKTMFLPVKAVGDNTSSTSNHANPVDRSHSSSSVSSYRDSKMTSTSSSSSRRTARSPSPLRSSRHRNYSSSGRERTRNRDRYSYHRHRGRDEKDDFDYGYEERRRRDGMSDLDYRRKRR
ncbi:splicing factor Cwf28 [Schizosaccharomyces cryophilus OY26]|uniref:Pre-mRNA-splicing factor n=1 Tax=Schizosaccharomyces cryophilus (strain OY26 / ATCC MYA-4695 / CBS 11777 / NBRC 106824 / NRRL Y48691) TaxID=653667 RepID=S9W102_SCHCR|nr:splicing factor Cwf28 [Schizosaccharomyces cryophilus OY26]EPY53573.1 splicing factor Cwf28 [Schizosaccharomyces cryophilus OY26]